MPRKEYEPNRHLLSIEAVSTLACEALIQEGEHSPLILAQGNGLPVGTMLSHMPSNFEQRIALMARLGAELKLSGDIRHLKQVFFIHEAWYSSVKDGKLPNVRPSQDPQRKEVLIVAQWQVARNQGDVRIFEMIRSGEDFLELQPLAIPQDAEKSIQSPLLEAFVHGFRLSAL